MIEPRNLDEELVLFKIYDASKISEKISIPLDPAIDREFYKNANDIAAYLYKLASSVKGRTLHVAFDTTVDEDHIEMSHTNFLKVLLIIIDNKNYGYLRLTIGEDHELWFFREGAVFLAKTNYGLQGLKNFVKNFANWLYWRNHT